MTKTYSDNSVRVKKFNVITKDGEEFYQETPEWIAFKNKKKAEKIIQGGNLPPHVIDLSFNDLIKMKDKVNKLETYISRFEEKFKHVHLYFWSLKNGTQKTTTASILAKELALLGYSVVLILMSDLSKLLTKEGFEEDANEEINRYLEVDFLIIDDSFDSKKITVYKSGYQIPFIDTFLRKRLESKRKATCFTSNVSLSDIDEKVFGVSLVKLLERSILDPWEFTVPFSVRNDFNPEDLWS
jgi:DNA replication protein DnaC